jgi:ferredoxin
MKQPVALSVDMVRCTGHGICAWLFPERVDLDEWGFAHVDPTPVTAAADVRKARRAERACPRRALAVTPAAAPATAPSAAGRPTV